MIFEERPKEVSGLGMKLSKDRAFRNGESRCKGPEAGECLVGLRNSRVASMAGGR